MPRSTATSWARRQPPRDGATTPSEPIITRTEGSGRQPTVPFVGLAEGMVAAAFRNAGVPTREIRRALGVLADQIGVEHALASGRLFTDGSRLLYDYATEHDVERLLAVVVTGQGVFNKVVNGYLRRITYGPDGWARRLVLPITARDVVEVDPERGFGQPLFIRGGAPMRAVLDRFQAGEPLASVAADFELDPTDVEDVIRASLPQAA